MALLRRIFFNWWFVSIATALVLILALAVLLPVFVGPLRPWWARLAIAGAIAMLWGAATAWRILSGRAASSRLAHDLVETEVPASEESMAAERLKLGLAGLKTASGGGRDYLYSRPWVMIIGPPGAGKTTALVNSGLRFPFSDESMKGVGGTRNLDFWFADEAVVVDTAGRYTTQDSDADRDRDGWLGFLKSLRRNRPLQPVNSVLVAIGFDELALADVAAIDRHAATVRRRLGELRLALDVSPPVYVMFTKADLLAGFTEFFDDLDVEGRRAVLGSTFRWEPGRVPTGDEMAEAFDEMAQSVTDRTSKRLQDEADARRRALILGFPGQLEATRSRVIRFLSGAFPAEAGEQAAPVRGFYLASGVQSGTPMDRLLGGLASVYDAQPQTGQQGRAYFINRLIKDVILPEAGLVQQSARGRRSRMLAMGAAFAAMALVALPLLGFWIGSFLQNRSFQDQMNAAAASANLYVQRERFDLAEVNVNDPDLEMALPLLNALRDLPYGAGSEQGPGLTMRFGLFQSNLRDQGRLAYGEALQRVMLPRMLLRMEQSMRENATDQLALYEALKAYLMLGGHAPSMDRNLIKTWVINDWETNSLPGGDRAATREHLTAHLDALLADPGFGRVWAQGRAPLDAALVDNVRARIQSLSVADRAYALIKLNAAAMGGADWQASAVLSAGAARAFLNGDQLLQMRIPFFFTKAGYERAYQVGLQTVQVQLERDLWVMGGDADVASLRAQMGSLRQGVAANYAREYTQAWDGLVTAMTPASYFTDVEAFGAVTTTPSPMKVLLAELRANTTFTAPTGVEQAQRAVAERVARAVPTELSGAVRSQIAPAAGGVDAGREIQNHFNDLHIFVGTAEAPGPIDEFIAKLRAAVVAKGQADRAGGGMGSEAAQGEFARAMSELSATAAVAPGMLRTFASRAAEQGDSARLDSARGAVGDAYVQSLLPACRSVTEDRYPFVAGSLADATVADMAEMFGMGGRMFQFAQARLDPLIDRSGPVWRWRTDNPVSQAFNPTSAEQFQRADSIRRILIAGASARVQATTFSGAVTSVKLEVGGQELTFANGQPGERRIQWMPGVTLPARVTLYAGEEVIGEPIGFEGPWSLFRLLESTPAINAGPSAFQSEFGSGASKVVFRFTYDGEVNPFSRARTWQFRCPPGL